LRLFRKGKRKVENIEKKRKTPAKQAKRGLLRLRRKKKENEFTKKENACAEFVQLKIVLQFCVVSNIEYFL